MQVYEEKTDLHFFRAIANLNLAFFHLIFVYILKLKYLTFFLRKDVSLQPPGEVKKRIDLTRI